MFDELLNERTLKREAVAWRFSLKEVFLKISQNSQENACVEVSFFEASGCNFIKKETPVQAFSCEFSKVFKNSFFI